MAWGEPKVVLDETGNLANVSVVWTDPDTTLGVFLYSRRSQVGVMQADAFIAEAIEKRDTWQVYQANNIAKSAWVLDRLNIADPKAV